jgi:hypothetical protein
MAETMIKAEFLEILDHREGNPKISMADALMSGFAVFSLKEPSLLAFDKRRKIDGNLESIYRAKDIPCDTQMRAILDEVDPEKIRPAYKNIFRELQRGKALEPMVFFQGCYLLSLDGTGYFSSKKICSDSCMEKVNSKTCEITYHQQLFIVLFCVYPLTYPKVPLYSTPRWENRVGKMIDVFSHYERVFTFFVIHGGGKWREG